MFPSRYNQVSKIDEKNYAIFNPLSGAFDIADEAAKNRFEALKAENPGELEYWRNRGYVFDDKKAEQAYVAQRYQDYLKETENNGIQFLLILTYGCNFKCPYCYQKEMPASRNLISKEMVEAFVEFVENYRKEQRKEVYVTLFGGEPLLPSNRERVEQIITLMGEKKIPVSLVTNGYYLTDYLDVLEKAEIKEIQVTFDGDREVHNRRRFQSEGEDSFEKILQGMIEAKKRYFPIHTRLIIDRITLNSLPGLAKTLDANGFLDLPGHLYKSSLGRNYELIDDYIKPEDLFTLDEMYSEYTKAMEAEPLLKKLHSPSYFGIRRVIEQGEMYVPSFDTCPAGKSEFVFDNSGQIFGCTASCGREGYELGTFYPKLEWNEEALREWQERSILTIDECTDCSVGVVCGGGCGVIAKTQNGKVQSPNCKPIKEVMDIGIQYYRKELLGTAE